MNVMEEILEAI